MITDRQEAKTQPLQQIKPNRKITGISAILLPYTDDGAIDWDGFRAHVARTSDAGITPAVNMDTGYVNLLTDDERLAVLKHTQETLGGRNFVAGAFVGDQPGDAWNPGAVLQAAAQIQQHGGTPVIFQSYGLTSRADIAGAYAEIGREVPQFIAFELGKMFAPFGQIYSLETYAEMLDVPQCLGAKHSSLSRQLEWERLELRDSRRPDFKVFTGNDLAIDMVMYGSDYLLGLSTFAPDLFARRDAMWAAGDPGFYELNDILQYLGFLAFRPPVPAYKHSAAQFLKLRGWLKSDQIHRNATRRPDSDVEILRDIVGRLS